MLILGKTERMRMCKNAKDVFKTLGRLPPNPPAWRVTPPPGGDRGSQKSCNLQCRACQKKLIGTLGRNLGVWLGTPPPGGCSSSHPHPPRGCLPSSKKPKPTGVVGFHQWYSFHCRSSKCPHSARQGSVGPPGWAAFWVGARREPQDKK